MQPVRDTILHDYPYPISKCYERLVRTHDVLDRRDQLRYLFEVTLKYCACLAISQYVQSKVQDATTDAALGCLTRPSLGHWLNLLRQCLRTEPEILTDFAAAVRDRANGRTELASAYGALRRAIDPAYAGRPEAVTPFAFFEAMITYRNRSSGHGAPQRDQAEALMPLLEGGLLDVLEHLTFLRGFPLVHLSEIRAERHRFVHSLTRLTGVAQVALPDYVTTSEEALLGHDRSVFVVDGASGAPVLNLHPLIIYAADDVYMLQHSDLRHTVEYLCYHTGKAYQADHIYEDFRDRFSQFLASQDSAAPAADAEAIYESCVSMSLLDGKIEAEERVYLDELAKRLRLDPERAQSIEEAQAASIAPTAAGLSRSPAVVTPPADVQVSRLSALVEEQAGVLKRCGGEILECVRRRPDPTQPMRLPELARLLVSSPSGVFRTMSPQQIARLIVDVQNHGFVPGLVRTTSGYAVIEDHIAFKLTRDRGLKERIARAAAKLVQPGMRIALDGGSTTLPIADEIVAAIDADFVSDLVVLTNSIPVAQRFSDLVERRGWLDSVSPVQILICGGRIRAVTKAVAEMSDTSTHTHDFLDAMLTQLGGLDCCFVGANGLTADDGLTMPTPVELSTKRQFLAAASDPYIVADVTKFGQRHPVQIADWQSRLTVLTNRSPDVNPELERVLMMQRTAQIVFAEDEDD